MSSEPTIQDVLNVIQVFSAQVDRRFDGVDERFKSIDERFGGITEVIGNLATHIDEQVANLRSEMATKKDLTDLRDDLALLARRGNTKLTTLVDELVARKSLDPVSAQRILALEPFPQA